MGVSCSDSSNSDSSDSDSESEEPAKLERIDSGIRSHIREISIDLRPSGTPSTINEDGTVKLRVRTPSIMSVMSGESGMAPETPSENSRKSESDKTNKTPVFQLHISPPEGRPRLSSWLEPGRKFQPLDPDRLSIPKPGGAQARKPREVRELGFFEERECEWWCGCVTFGVVFTACIGGLMWGAFTGFQCLD